MARWPWVASMSPAGMLEPAALVDVPAATPRVADLLAAEFAQRLAYEQDPEANPKPSETLGDLATRTGLQPGAMFLAFDDYRLSRQGSGSNPRAERAALVRELLEEQLAATGGTANLTRAAADLNTHYTTATRIRDEWLARTGTVPATSRNVNKPVRAALEEAFVQALADGTPLDTGPFRDLVNVSTLTNWLAALGRKYGERPAPMPKASPVTSALEARLPNILQDRAAGHTFQQIADKHGLSMTTAFRAIKGARDANTGVTADVGAAEPTDVPAGQDAGPESGSEPGDAESAGGGGQVVAPESTQVSGLEPGPGSRSWEGVPMPPPGLSPPRAERWEPPPLEEPLVPAMRNHTGHDRVGDDLEMPETRFPLHREGDQLLTQGPGKVAISGR